MFFFRNAAAFLALIFLASCAPKPDLIVLLPDEDGKVGKVAVETDGGGTVLLDKPYASVTVGGSGKLETATVSKEEVGNLFADALAAKPAGTVFFNLYYKSGSLQLTTESQGVLEKLFKDVDGRQAAEVQATGYAYFAGAGEGGDGLALQRARKVADALISRGTRRVVAAKLVKGSGQKPASIPAGRVRVIVR
jgi:outer membrane protein OmpA-like peptidoglycan-associated protein